jgi:hypothetical protein
MLTADEIYLVDKLHKTIHLLESLKDKVDTMAHYDLLVAAEKLALTFHAEIGRRIVKEYLTSKPKSECI